MIRSVLIANRGEIACRIIRTARSMGIRTVAVYSDADRGAAHVAQADAAVWIGGSKPAESYLRGDAIIRAAIAAGVDAIHPGYGFLSENPDFVAEVAAAGLIFVGPSAEAIRAMGLKDAAKARMVAAGVPVVPGYHGAEQDEALLAAEADKIGYPVMIKAVAGGGGKGMRIVFEAASFAVELASCRAEARAAFGNAAVLIEKYIEKPRHIEVQVFGDAYGGAVHLYERDCSLQRRHQKVIEEAPAPGMTVQVREAMGQAAVQAAQAIGYQGAGTVEFIVDGRDGLRVDGFWFMEMNTRLQVEHPVTEAVTGIDLVEWQLRIANGEPLPLRQQDILLRGHAFEARLYAEDAANGFLPVTGQLAHLAFPEGVRADTGVRSGDTISPWYDPMIAKVIAQGPTRAVALQKLVQGLARTEVVGTKTNIGFLGALARHEGFQAGDVDTGLIGRDLDWLVATQAPEPEQIGAAALVALGLWHPQEPQTGFSLWGQGARHLVLERDGAADAVSVTVQGPDRHLVRVGGIELQAVRDGDGWTIGERPIRDAMRVGAVVALFGAVTHEWRIVDPLDRRAEGEAEAALTLAPMPGLVREVLVRAGDAVQAGQRLAVLEAMKMEHSLKASRDGVVAEVLAKAGAQVEAGAPLIRLEEEDTP